MRRKGYNVHDKRQTALRREGRRLLAMLIRARQWIPAVFYTQRELALAGSEWNRGLRSSDALPTVIELRQLLRITLIHKHQRQMRQDEILLHYALDRDEDHGFEVRWWTDAANDVSVSLAPAQRPTGPAEWRAAWRHVWRATRCRARMDGFAGLSLMSLVDPDEPHPWWTREAA